FQAEDGIRDGHVTGVQTCALPIYVIWSGSRARANVIASFTVQPGPQSRASPISSPRTFFMASTQAMTCFMPRSVMSPRSGCAARSEERRVGKEGRSRWSADHEEKE